MLEKTYSRAVLAVTQNFFDKYLLQFSSGGVLPTVLEKVRLHRRYVDGVKVIVISWSAESLDESPTIGLDGDNELIGWFNSKPLPKPHRILIWGGEYGSYEKTCAQCSEIWNAFEKCIDRGSIDKLSSNLEAMLDVRGYLADLEILA